MTLAIGDGANGQFGAFAGVSICTDLQSVASTDVSMIQAADVGVGISGEEGLQAVNCESVSIILFSAVPC